MTFTLHEQQFQSTPPVKAATCRISNFRLCRYISIHAAREGGDPLAFKLRVRLEISIHAAREGGDIPTAQVNGAKPAFQSTPPVKAATYYIDPSDSEFAFQSTPPVKAATYAEVNQRVKAFHFNPRRP